MDEVERQLPNGFHDGELRRLSVDYEQKTLCIEVEFWVGELGGERCELYRLGRVTVTGLELLVIENPDCRLLAEGLTIDGGPGQPSTSFMRILPLSPGTFLYWLYVNPWNCFIRFAGRAATLEWIGEGVSKE